ncbi:MAG TPA: alpha/beta hydrolase [Acidimicrobiia bacterium]|nr:alpha/beta hydrolase [Acidimicrobiia bacterium]
MALRTVPFGRERKDLANLRSAIARGAPSAAVPLAEMRATFHRITAAMPLGDGIEHREGTVAGRPAEWTRIAASGAGDSRTDAAILHFHGGGYVIGSPVTTRSVTAGLARHTGLPVLAPDYRLAPEHPFPAAVDDALAVYCELLDGGLSPGRVVVSGDSAGGGLAMALVLTLRDRHLSLPAGAVGISPLLDLTLSSPSIDANRATDPQVTREFLEVAVAHYLPAGADPKAPLASPVFADMSGFPPLLLQVGGDEALLDDSVRFGEAAETAGVDVTVECWEAMMHVWHSFAPRFPEGEAALAAVAAWIHDRLGRA